MIARMTANATPVLLLSSRLGLVSVPDLDLGSLSREEEIDRNTVRECLQSLGENMGLTLLARGEAFPGSPALPESGEAESEAEFPDAAVRKSLEGLDAVWLEDDEPVACFVVESGFAGWEGIRRLADLVALHPKLKAPLYAVTLASLKPALLAEVQRPALCLPKKPLSERLRLLDWDRLRTEAEQLGERVRYLKPEFVEGISEPVVAPKV
ncbi:MAG: hypothetical protein JF616_18285 [Fibrobacteres bacterium]|jgi:hypothetical protein|nr:hypothetical protein [Fibrobacterota bacterium]